MPLLKSIQSACRSIPKAWRLLRAAGLRVAKAVKYSAGGRGRKLRGGFYPQARSLRQKALPFRSRMRRRRGLPPIMAGKTPTERDKGAC
jgi:hypothetical protein